MARIFVALLALATVGAGAAAARQLVRLAVAATTVVATDDVRARTLTVEIWYPARRVGRDVPPRPGRWPLVLIAHGICSNRTSYSYLAVELASKGFVVAAPDFPGFTTAVCDAGGPFADVLKDPPRDLSFLRRLLHERGGPLASVARHVRGVATGLVGHSIGGLTVLNATVADGAFTTCVLLAPSVGSASAPLLAGLDPAPAVLVMGATLDTLPNFDLLTRPFFEGLPPPAFLVRIVGGTHRGFTDDDPALPLAMLAVQHDAVKRFATLLFQRYLARTDPPGRWVDIDGGEVDVTARPR
jgi:dienelactone hydrolase